MPGKLTEIKAGSRWVDEAVAFVTRTPTLNARVMAVADGYVMLRFPYGMPFVMSKKEFLARFSPAGRAALSNGEEAQS